MAPSSPPIICVANQKGGVGKTTVAINLAAALAERGIATLIFDLDPQANATTGLGLVRGDGLSAYEVLVEGTEVGHAAYTTPVAGLSCVPGSVDLAGAEIELVSMEARENRLRAALGSGPLPASVVLIDCPPSLGLLTLNALVAATDLLIPVQCEYYALEGLGQLLATVERVRAGFNPGLRIGGLVLTMYDARTKLSSQVSRDVRAHFHDAVYRTVIPRSVRLSEAPSFGQSVLSLDPSSRAAIAFRLLAAEVAERHDLKAGAPDAEAKDVYRHEPGPHGRGYGTVAPKPPGVSDSWPPRPPWSPTEGKDDIDAPARAHA